MINHPQKIPDTDRASIAARLEGVPHCRVPKTKRFPASSLAGTGASALFEEFGLPLLVRVCGSHGGDQFEKIADIGELAAFARRYPASDYYVSEYVSYESTDGYFRKYRLIFVNGEIYPYHLAIAGQWKVHRFRSDVAGQTWAREEEERFLRTPETVLSPAHWSVLRQIERTVGLDYFGIDCAIHSSGDLLLFETNATMLVYSDAPDTDYKAPIVARIKKAFDAMLRDRLNRAAA